MSSQEETTSGPDWGIGKASHFLTSRHSHPNAALDATQVHLPKPFVVCVVGASRGIGAGIAYSYARAGASSIVLSSRRVSGLEETGSKCRQISPNINIEIVPCDITSPESVASLSKRIQAVYGRLDAVAVNSGYSGPVVLRLTETDPTTFFNATNVNYLGTFYCAKYLTPLLLATEGGAKTLLIVSSLAAALVRGPIANSQYCVSKTAQLKLVEHIHEQYHQEGLATYAVHPGSVLSEMAGETTPEVFRPYLTDSPDLCGAFCVWLTKDGDKRAWLSGSLVSANWDVD